MTGKPPTASVGVDGVSATRTVIGCACCAARAKARRIAAGANRPSTSTPPPAGIAVARPLLSTAITRRDGPAPRTTRSVPVAVSIGLPQFGSYQARPSVVLRFQLLIAIVSAPATSCPLTPSTPNHGAPLLATATTGRDDGPAIRRPDTMAAVCGTPGGVKRKKSALTAAIAPGPRCASSSVVRARPTAAPPAFTAASDQQARRSMSST